MRYFIWIFVIMCILSIGSIANFCLHYAPLTFDNQALLTWDYTASIGMFPYKDIFYPYGILPYFKNHNSILGITYFLFTPLLFTSIFFIFKNIFKEKLFSFLSCVIFYLFIIKITGLEIFTRYGIAVISACLFANLFYSYRQYLTRKYITLFGFLAGIIFSFFNDQGIYVVVLFIIISLFDSVLKKSFNQLIQVASFFLLGFFIGIVPLLLYLFANHALIDFFVSILNLAQITLYAKTPYIHSLRSIDNLFTLGLLFSTITFLVYKFTWGDRKVSVNTYIQIVLVICLLLLEQKSIIRSMDAQLTFIGLLLLICLFYESKQKLQKHNILLIVGYLLVGVIILFILPLRPANKAVCLSSETIPYEIVIDKLKTIPGFEGKVFSFPADPIFYRLLHQRTPYFLNTYDGSSLSGQKDSISYIQNNSINFVLINSKVKSLQDEVPDYIRTPYLMKYILNNFTGVDKVNEFLVLRKTDSSDFFTNNLNQFSDYKKYLLMINLENIPESEGYYKKQYLPSTKTIMASSVEQFNSSLRQSSIDSHQKFIIVYFTDSGKEKVKTSLTLETKDNLRTTIYFNRCEKGIPCILNLSHIPLFYKNRVLKKLSIDQDATIMSINLMRISDSTRFW